MQDISTEKGEGAFALDNRGRLLFLSSEAERMLGWYMSEVLDKNFFEIVQFKVDAIATLGASECSAIKSIGCSHLRKGATIRLKDASILPIMFISMPLFDKGKMCGKVYVFREYKDSRVDEEMYRGIIESAGSVIVKLDVTGKVVFTNEYAKELLGSQIDANLPAKVIVALQREPESLNAQMRLKKRCRTASGRSRLIAWTVSVVRGINQKVVGAVCVGNDVTEAIPATQANSPRKNELLPGQSMTQSVLDRIKDGVITIAKNGTVEYLNPIAEQLTGWACHEAKGQQLKDVFHVVDEKTRQPKINAILGRSDSLVNRSGEAHTSLLLRRDGWEFTVEESSSVIRDDQGHIVGAALVFRDVTEIQGMERWMLYEATHDALTGLLNRREFDSQLNQALTSARADGRHHALCYINLDNFKKINDIHGHDAGDELLKQTATLLHNKVRDTDVLARLGGDEFVVLLKNCSIHNAMESTQVFCNALRDFGFEWQNEPVKLGASIGLVPITADCGGIADIMSVADSACFVAKDKGRHHRVHVYHPQDVAMKQRHGDLKWVRLIRQALDENRFRLFCQSIVPLNSSNANIIHHEILLRMQDGDNVIRPAAFIAAAERYSLMPSIDRWVVQHALSLLGERLKRNQQIGIFAINLSGQSLDDENFLGFVIDQIDKTQVPAVNLCFEITETTAISNLISATRFMSILRGMGCRFALDDFGRGFSSYSYLKNFQVDYLKIDGTFVRNLAADSVDYAMVESINQIGHIMGIQTIAEFVETEEVLEKLIELGVDHVQGYQLGKPRPLWPSFQS